MCNCAVEFHDSEVESIRSSDTQISIRLAPAYIHESRGLPGIDNGTVLLQDADLIVVDGTIDSDLPSLPCLLSTARIEIDGRVFSNCLPIPFHQSGSVTIELDFMFERIITIRGREVELKLIGPRTYLEEFSKD